MTKTLTLFSILILLTTCGPHHDKTDKENKKESAEQKIRKLAEDYNAVQNWDTLELYYTIEYQRFFSDTDQLILLEYVDINDIYEKDNKYFISGNCGTYSTFYFQLECSKQQMNQILKQIKDKYPMYIGLIVRVTKVEMLEMALGTEVEDEYLAYIIVQGTEDFVMDGKLIDFYIDNRDD